MRQLLPRARGEEGHQETQAEECRKIVFALNELRVFKRETGLNDCSKCSSSFEGISIFFLNPSRQNIIFVS